QRPAAVLLFDVHREPEANAAGVHAVRLAVDFLEVVRHHGEALGGLDDPVPDQVGERNLLTACGQLGVEGLAAGVERGRRDVAERGRGGDRERLGHVLNQPSGGTGDGRGIRWNCVRRKTWRRSACRRTAHGGRRTLYRDHRELRELSVLKQLPPLLAHRSRVAQVLLVHGLYEGGVVGAVHEFAHGLESIRYLISQYAVATSSLTHEPGRFESWISGQGPHRPGAGAGRRRLLPRSHHRRLPNRRLGGAV